MPDPVRPTLVYITSRGHSGSTLTEMLVGAHSQAVPLGELKQFGTEHGLRCRCDASPLSACPFWGEVDRALQRDSGLKLDLLEVESPNREVFEAHNLALIEAARRVSGADFPIDSSKSLARLARLEASGLFDLRVIHLVRSPLGVIYSNVKRGRDWRAYSRNYTVGMFKTRAWLGAREAIELRYERLASHPEAELRRVMQALGLGFEAQQLAWAEQDTHNFAGNDMRLGRDSTIRKDTAWRRGLTPGQMLGVAWLTLPTRMRSPALYEAHRPYWKGEGTEAWKTYRRKRREKARKRREKARKRRLEHWRKSLESQPLTRPGVTLARRLWRRLRTAKHPR